MGTPPLANLNLADIEKLPVSEQRQILRMLEEYSEKKDIEDAKNKFIGYARYMFPRWLGPFVEGRHHRKMADIADGINRGELKRVCVHLPPRHALDVNTEIPTPKGFVKIVDLQVGDEVFGPDGLPTKVIGKSDVYRDQPVWRAETDDGASVRCDADHLWSVSLCRKRRSIFTTHKTSVLVDKISSSREHRKPMLPPHRAVVYSEVDLPIGPYTLGVWLGDGHCRQAVITSHDNDSPIVRARIESEGHETTDQSTPMTFGVLNIKAKLRDELGILGNKKIPDVYLRSSVEQRRALLHGLMDTDGNVSKAGQCVFSTSSEAIRDGFWELCHSLGIKASYCSFIPKIGDKEYKRSYRFSFYDPDACHLPRKRERCRGYTKKPTGRYISFTPDGTANVVCIKVAREDGLFLAGRGYIVTHNTKSEFWSWLNPSFYLGHHPNHKIIQVSNTAELAAGFGRRVRDVMESKDYQNLFGGVTIKADSRSAGRWNTNKGGDYYATGIGGALAGRGANILNIDDPTSEVEALAGQYNPKVFDDGFEWYGLARQRLQPQGAIVICATRWSKRDIPGQVIAKAIDQGDADEWKVFDFPAIFEDTQNPLWPEFWSYEELMKVKREIPPARWNAQYQQNPVTEGGAIIKREDWKPWDKDRLPSFSYIIDSWDTAFTSKTANNYSARTRWGVFYFPDADGRNKANVMLIDSFRDRLEFPALKAQVKEDYGSGDYVDLILVEGRGSGLSLIDELHYAGFPVEAFTPARKAGGVSNDKVARANNVADIFRSGVVWYNTNCPLNDVTIEECSDLPRGDSDDLADTVTQAIQHLRDRAFIGSINDTYQLFEDDEVGTVRPKGRIY